MNLERRAGTLSENTSQSDHTVPLSAFVIEQFEMLAKFTVASKRQLQ